jgi:hypothetical protein
MGMECMSDDTLSQVSMTWTILEHKMSHQMHVHHQRSMLQETWLQGNSEIVFKWVTGHVLQQGPSPQLMLTKSLGDNHCNLGKLFVTIKNRESLTKIWSTLCLSSKKEMQPSGHEKLVWVKPSSSQGTNSLVLHNIVSREGSEVIGNTAEALS